MIASYRYMVSEESTSDHEGPEVPRFHSNVVNIAGGAFDMTLTFLQMDPTALPQGQVGPHKARIESQVQVVLPLGHAKALIPLLVKAISDYEQKFGVIPSPGFEQLGKA